MELETAALPADGPTDRVDDAELGAPLELRGVHHAPVHHDGHRRGWVRTRQAAQLLRLLAGDPAEQPKHLNQFGSGRSGLFEVNDLPVLQIDGQSLIARGYGEDA